MKPRSIHEVLRTTWGYPSFRPMQEQVINSVMQGQDTLALMPTGGGKSLCFQVPALATGKLCIVVSPLIALMKDQVQHLKAKGVRAVAVTSGMSYMEIDNALESAANGAYDFLYVSPERLGASLFKDRLPRMPIGLIAVDEAHCISQWGYDFRPAYMLIHELREVHPDVPILALTATATPVVAQDIMERLAFRRPNLMQGSFARPELTFWVSHAEDKHGRLLRIVHHVPGSGIIYLRRRKGTVQIARFLQQHGISAMPYHAGMPFEEREQVQRQWTDGTIRYVAATNAFGMGIDKPDVRCVVHMEPPPDLESYYQEAGRGGRDGRPAYAFLLAIAADEDRMRENLETSFPSIGEVRRVYQAFADEHRIAMGAGEFEAYTLGQGKLEQRTGLRPATVHAALKALELDGHLALSEGAHDPSRAMMRAEGKVVHDLRVFSSRFGKLIEAMLRMYGGLFEEPTIIEEEKLAQVIGRSVTQVRALLKELERDNVIFYRPRNDLPMATLLKPRTDATRLTLEPHALQQRRERAEKRQAAIADYAFRSKTCREVELLRYFGQPAQGNCGRCDNCRARERPVQVSEPSQRWVTEERGGPSKT